MARPLFALVALLLVASCAHTTPAGSDAGQPAPSAGAEPVAQFLDGVRSARYADYAGKPGAKVASEQEFEAMRTYVLDRYNTAPVVRTYLVGETPFDCMGAGNPSAKDDHCPPGTVPVRRVTLTELTRFANLRAFLSKDPGGGGLPPVPPPTP